MVASIDSYCCYVVFAFSIGVWDAKLAKTSKAARVASINRVMLLLLFRSCVFHWCLQHESGQTARAASLNRVMLFLINVVFVFSIGV